MGGQRAAAADAALLDKGAGSPDAFAVAIDAPGMSITTTQQIPYVSQKGAPKTPEKLLDLLKKPGREDVLKMYSDDIAEFSIPISGNVMKEGHLDYMHVAGLCLSP